MQLFYIPDIANDIIELAPEESRHCVKSLRMKASDTLYITDGRGTLSEGRIVTPDATGCTIEIVKRDFSPCRADYRLHVAVAPTKNADRIEWFVEKAVEIGIDEITPLITRNSERVKLNRARLEKIAISAMKQSLQRHLPVIHEECDFEKFINHTDAYAKIICHGHYEHPLKIAEACKAGDHAVVLIGPEGDFSEEEILMADKAGYLPVSLGENRLRTETAALTAVCAMALINQKH